MVADFLPNVFGSFGVRIAARQSVGTWDVRNGEPYYWQAVTGQIDVVSAWDDYVERMMNAGLDRLLDSVAAQR